MNHKTSLLLINLIFAFNVISMNGLNSTKNIHFNQTVADVKHLKESFIDTLRKFKADRMDIDSYLKSENFVTVGKEKSCDFSAIEKAIDSGSQEIRIANSGSPYKENLSVHDKNITIRGGFSTCDMAWGGLADDVNAVIDGNQNGLSVLHISGVGKGQTQKMMRLERLDFVNGLADFGGGIFVDGSASVSLSIEKVYLKNNHALHRGGGIFLGQSWWGPGGAYQDIIIKETAIIGNTTSDSGAGIGCYGGSRITLFLAGDNRFEGGVANMNGGAIYADSCTIWGVSPLIMDNNTSYSSGGAISTYFAEINLIGSELCVLGQCFGSNDFPVEISNNLVIGDLGEGGGGAHISGNSDANFINVHMSNNKAEKGGAVAVKHSARFSTYSYNSKECWSPGACNQYEDNHANQGGAIYINGHGKTMISTAVFKGNQASEGIVLDVDAYESQDTEVYIEGVLMVENGLKGSSQYDNSNLIKLSEKANVSIQLSTIANNHIEQSVISDTGDVNFPISLFASIFSEDVPIYDSKKNNMKAGCLIVNESKTLPVNDSIVKDNPEFISVADSNYHVSYYSPAVDFCSERMVQPTVLTDMDGDNRIIDIPAIDNVYGPIDIGYDEVELKIAPIPN